MKKIPTLFKRIYENHMVVDITPEVAPELECVLKGETIPTIKFDGSCCAISNEIFYKRYDCKKGKKPPEHFLPADNPDPITGHWPGWVPVDPTDSADKWFVAAYQDIVINHPEYSLRDWTYEAIGKHFNGNPYCLDYDTLIPHGMNPIEELQNKPLTFNVIKNYLKKNYIEGIVFWKDDKPLCKIKRTDFGFDWPVR